MAVHVSLCSLSLNIPELPDLAGNRPFGEDVPVRGHVALLSPGISHFLCGAVETPLVDFFCPHEPVLAWKAIDPGKEPNEIPLSGQFGDYVALPFDLPVSPGVKEVSCKAGRSVPRDAGRMHSASSRMWSFAMIAVGAGSHEIVRIAGSALAPGDLVVDMKDRPIFRGLAAVSAPEAVALQGPKPHGFGNRTHHSSGCRYINPAH
jgi:hypothetical protein